MNGSFSNAKNVFHRGKPFKPKLFRDIRIAILPPRKKQTFLERALCMEAYGTKLWKHAQVVFNTIRRQRT
jgi:hypothetical protein